MSRLRHRPRETDRDGSGQAVVELALVAVPLALILTGIIQFGFILGAQIGLTNVGREAARYASVAPTTSANVASRGAAVEAKLADLLVRNVQSYQSSRLDPAGTRVCYTSYRDESLKWSVRVRVDVVYLHPLFMPIVTQILDMFDGSPDQSFRLSTSEEMRVENLPFDTDPGVTGCY